MMSLKTLRVGQRGPANESWHSAIHLGDKIMCQWLLIH